MVQPNLPSFPPSSLPPFLLDEITSRPLHPAELSIRNIHGDIDRLSNLTRPIIDPSLRLHSFRDRIICYRAISRPDSSRQPESSFRDIIRFSSREVSFFFVFKPSREYRNLSTRRKINGATDVRIENFWSR